jgi:4-oxalocrotonate tautomerase
VPYVNIKITKEGGPDNMGATVEEKKQLIDGVTKLLQEVLNKDPATTFVIIDEVSLDNWGISGKSVTTIRESQ